MKTVDFKFLPPRIRWTAVLLESPFWIPIVESISLHFELDFCRWPSLCLSPSFISDAVKFCNCSMKLSFDFASSFLLSAWPFEALHYMGPAIKTSGLPMDQLSTAKYLATYQRSCYILFSISADDCVIESYMFHFQCHLKIFDYRKYTPKIFTAHLRAILILVSHNHYVEVINIQWRHRDDVILCTVKGDRGRPLVVKQRVRYVFGQIQ